MLLSLCGRPKRLNFTQLLDVKNADSWAKTSGTQKMNVETTKIEIFKKNEMINVTKAPLYKNGDPTLKNQDKKYRRGIVMV